MKKINILWVSALAILFFVTSCDQYYNPGLNVTSVKEDTTAVNEAEVLADFLKISGDYINSKKIPSMAKTGDIAENLSEYLVIDLRKKDEYVAGHIDGALNVKFSELLDYLEANVTASNYEKIVITCRTGQTASYATSLLRLIGYDNVYAMKFGMNVWNKEIPNLWSKNVSDKYASQLETKQYLKGKKTHLPEINTGKRNGSEILYARVKQVFKEGFKKAKAKVDDVFANTQDYYIINYWPEDKYLKGHIPGAIQFTPKKSLAADQDLTFLPLNKKVLVYCYTGQHSAHVVAYLRTLGYDAYTLLFGANSFMHSNMVKRANWNGFKAAEKIKNFPLIEGEKPSDKTTKTIAPVQGTEQKVKKVVVKRKKKEVEGGCG